MTVTDPRRTIAQVVQNASETLTPITDDQPTERTVTTSLTSTLRRRDGVRVLRNVNLWEDVAAVAGDAVPPAEALDRYGHPLQPDIDVLAARAGDDGPTRPLIGIEVKYFPKYVGIDGHELLPKRVTETGEAVGGFYSGLGQTLSLASMGVDYVYLWHVFRVGSDQYRDQTSHRSVLETYTRRLTDTLDTLDVPVGYFAHGLAVDHDNRLLTLAGTRLLTDHPPVSDADAAPSPTQQLLHRAVARRFDERISSLGDLRGSKQSVTVSAELADLSRMDPERGPAATGTVRDSSTGDTRPLTVYDRTLLDTLQPGGTYQFVNAVDHYYDRTDEIQLLLGEEASVHELDR